MYLCIRFERVTRKREEKREALETRKSSLIDGKDKKAQIVRDHDQVKEKITRF